MRVPPRPVRHRLGDVAHRLVDVPVLELLGDPGEPCGEEKRLHLPVQPAVEAMDEVEQHPRVALHGAADVADDHQLAGLFLATAMPQLEQLAAVLRVVAERPTQVQRMPVPALQPSRAPCARVPRKRRHELPRLRHLRRRELREVLRLQHLASAERAGDVDAVAGLCAVLFLAPCVVRGLPKRRRSRLHVAVAAFLAHGAQVHREGLVFALPPEDGEGLVEDRQVLPPVYQQRAKRVPHVPPSTETDVLQHVHRVEHAPRVHVEPQPSQQPAEQQQVQKDLALDGAIRVCHHDPLPGSWPAPAAHGSALRGRSARPPGTSASRPAFRR